MKLQAAEPMKIFGRPQSPRYKLVTNHRQVSATAVIKPSDSKAHNSGAEYFACNRRHSWVSNDMSHHSASQSGVTTRTIAHEITALNAAICNLRSTKSPQVTGRKSWKAEG